MDTVSEIKSLPDGLFVVVEGIDGSGKSTLIRQLAEYYTAQGYTVVSTFEPGGTPYGKLVRALFLEHHQSLAPSAEVGLLLTTKAQLLRDVIEPALAAGHIVLCDRYTSTLYAYQGFGKGHDLEMIRVLIEAFHCYREPDLTLYLDVSPETSMDRGHKRRASDSEHNTLDDEGIEFRQRLIDGFIWRSHQCPPDSRWEDIDAEQSPTQVFREACVCVNGAIAQMTQRYVSPRRYFSEGE